MNILMIKKINEFNEFENGIKRGGGVTLKSKLFKRGRLIPCVLPINDRKM